MKNTNLMGFALAVSVTLVACGTPIPPTAAPLATKAPAAPPPTAVAPQPTAVVPATKAPEPTKAPEAAMTKKIKIGLVTDVGRLDDKSFNASAWAGLQKMAKELGDKVEVKAIETMQPTDYQKNINQFVSEDFDGVITVGFLMGDDTLAAAQAAEKAGKKTKFAIVDYAYDDKAPKNLQGIVFAEDQAGFLAGAAAGLMTKSNKVGGVYGLKIPPVCKFAVGFANGAKATNGNVTVRGVYQGANEGAPFNNPELGKKNALTQISEGFDVIFSAGGNTGNGGLLGIAEQAKAGKSVLGIGVDQDQWNTLTDAKPVLLTSAMKRVDVSIYNAAKSIVDGSYKPGVAVFDIKNDGVGIAPFHDLESKVPADAKAKLDKMTADLKAGTLKTGLPEGDPCK